MSTVIARTIERRNMHGLCRVAVLDDYRRVARDCADWSVLGDDVAVTFFHDHVDEQRQLVNRLAAFDVVVAMRERTPFPGDVLRQLPELRLLVATGMHHSVIDFDTATELGITVCGTQSWRGATATIELTWGLILGLARGIASEDAAIRNGGWQIGLGTLLEGKTLGIVGSRQSRLPAASRRHGAGDAYRRVEHQPHRRAGGRGRGRRESIMTSSSHRAMSSACT